MDPSTQNEWKTSFVHGGRRFKYDLYQGRRIESIEGYPEYAGYAIIFEDEYEGRTTRAPTLKEFREKMFKEAEDRKKREAEIAFWERERKQSQPPQPPKPKVVKPLSKEDKAKIALRNKAKKRL